MFNSLKTMKCNSLSCILLSSCSNSNIMISRQDPHNLNRKHVLLIFVFFVLSMPVHAIIEIANVDCICAIGKIELTVEPDPGYESAGPFLFAWEGPNNYTLEAQNPEDLTTPGLYTVTVTNAYGCQTVLSTFVERCLTIQSLTPICICPGGYGAAEVEVSGGSGNYAYAWKSAPGNGISDPTVANPLIYDPGSYTVLVTDSYTGCEVRGTVEVKVCNIGLSALVAVQPDCNEEGTSSRKC